MSDHGEQASRTHAAHGASGGSGHHGPAHGGHEEGHEGAPEWLISFADNVTLMMGFFVIMLAFSLGPKGGSDAAAQTSGPDPVPAQPDMLDLALSIRSAFHNPVDPASGDPNDQLLIERLMQRRGDVPVMEDGPKGNAYRLQSLRKDGPYGICASIPFDAQSTAISNEGRGRLLDVLEHIRGYNMILDLRGHVSAQEAHATDDRGMRLSFERAMAVAEFLCENGIGRGLLRVVSCGDGDRLQPSSYDPESHALNQRVEMVLTGEVAPDYALPASSPPNDDPDRK